ncbi:AraC family transcriptional regulator [Paenibacillus psychroresistens]|uniref:AraC family transcriptional regulator n=1 Tax=Paenibacillus psychroresistens TaxID=1778678 RepID=A0A6B8RFT1_9BACL|nr:AraC family transcriptional regulator [Paenibacillus psychroresistens]QGQ95030.1 AraC family transcriptional regulator [Paenibacillus psychroresistens]
MKIGIDRIYKTKTYFQRILLSVLLVTFFFLIVSSFVLLTNSEKTVVALQQESSMKMLSQIQFNIKSMDGMVRDLTNQVYNDNTVIPLLFQKYNERFDILKTQWKLDSMVSSTSYLHSILVYNGGADQLYAGGIYLGGDNSGIKDHFLDYLKSDGSIRKMQLTPMQIVENGKQKDIFSFFMFDSLDYYHIGESALIINVKAEWLLDNLNYINLLSAKPNEHIFMMDRQGKMYPSDLLAEDEMQELRSRVSLLGSEDAASLQYQTLVIGNKKYMATVIQTNLKDWFAVSVGSYKEMFGKLTKLRQTTILLTLLFIVLSIVASFMISRKLYKPIEDTLRVMKRHTFGQPPDRDKRDELTFISDEYRRVVDHLNQAMTERHQKQDMIKFGFLRKLISDSLSIREEELREAISEYPLKIDISGSLILCAIQIDGESYQHYTPKEKQVYEFAVSNIAEEIVSSRYPCEAVDMRNGSLILVISLPEHHAELLKALIKDVQKTVEEYYKISISASISDPFISHTETTAQYNLVLQVMMYRIVYGKGCLILAEMMRTHINNEDTQIPYELERGLVEAIRLGEADKAEESLRSLFQYFTRFQYDQIIYSVLHTVVLLKNTLREMNYNRLIPVSADLHSINQLIFKKETLDEMLLLLLDILNEITAPQIVEVNRHDTLIDTIKHMVEESYMDENVSLQGISSILKMSPEYIGRIFKKSESLSVADYIHEIRLSHAIHLLENKDYSIHLIMQKVGYGNQSYFFRLFKKKFGTTPKEYRLKKMIYTQ